MDGAAPSFPTSGAGNPLAGALDGIRIVDFSQIAAGPLATMLLADMGADVIKVEPPAGDVGRTLGPPFVEGESTLFMSLNRNKRGVVIDLKSDEGRAHALALLESADVLVESFRPGVADRLGIGHAHLKSLFPDLIYCSISAYGQDGPWSDRPGVDGVLQAVSGLMSITGCADAGPAKVQAPIVDMVTGYHAVIAILAGLRQRAEGQRPGHLDVNLYAGAFMLQQVPLAGFLTAGELPVRCGSGAPYATPNEAYATADGHILVAAYQPARWRAFCDAIGLTELAGDDRFAELPVRMRNRAELTAILETHLSRRPSAEWQALLEAADVICAPVSDYRDLAASPQIPAREMFVMADHPKAGDVIMPGFLIGGRAIAPRRPAPMLGEHDGLLADLAVRNPARSAVR